MRIEKYVVILSSENGDKTHLKMSLNRQDKTAEIHFADKAKIEDGTIYIIGEEITKQELKQQKYDYKMRVCANDDVDVVLVACGKTYVGSTGKPPKIKVLRACVERYENELEMCLKESENKPKPNEPVRGEGLSKKPLNYEAKIEVGLGGEMKGETPLKSDPEIDEETSVIVNETTEDFPLGNVDEKQENSPCNFVENLSTEGEGNRHEKGVENGVRTDESRIFAFDSVRFDGSNFYLSVKPQIDEIFVCYPEEELLNNLVPNSKWVHVDTSDGYYVVGLVLDGDVVSYICYGVPSTEKHTPPVEIADFAVWLSDGSDGGKGYWLIYQDAMTGKCLR